MIPNVFVSSTIEDLLHVRDGVRETVIELGYNPILSDFGDIGYLPTTSAIDSCLIAMKQCQIAVLIIGKRYGSPDDSGLSVTHKEFRTARDRNIPVFCLIDKEVISFKRVYDAAVKNQKNVFPGMDNAKSTFGLIQEVKDSPVNNGFIGFNSVTDAKSSLKRQLALYVGDLIGNAVNPVARDVREIMSELKTLRYYMAGSPENRKIQIRLLRALRFTMSDRLRNYKDLVEGLAQSLEEGIVVALKAATFDDLIEELSGSAIEIDDSVERYSFVKQENLLPWRSLAVSSPPTWLTEDTAHLLYGVMKNRKVVMNSAALRVFRSLHEKVIDSANESGQEEEEIEDASRVTL